MSKKHLPTLITTAILRPLVRLCLARGVRVQELEALLKGVLVAEARTAIEAARSEVSVSKISVITGINRTEVARLVSGDGPSKEKHDVLNRVIGLWSHGREYGSANGTPRPLSFQGLGSEFATLVSAVSKEVSPYPVLFELERIGAIRYDGDRAILQVVEYTPHGDVEHGVQVLSDDIEDLATAVEQNLTSCQEIPSVHLRTSYDNIDPAELPHIRRWLLEKGAAFHRDVRGYLSLFDRDINPSLPRGDERARVAVSLFSLGAKVEAPKELKPKKRGRKPCAPPSADQSAR